CCLFRIYRKFGTGPEYSYLVSVGVPLATTSFVAHVIGNMLIAINRFSAVCLKKKYDKGMLFCTILVFALTTLMCVQQTARGIAFLSGGSAFLAWITVQVGYLSMHSVAQQIAMILKRRQPLALYAPCMQRHHLINKG
ncbi:hypothetical protein GCK32_022504, partial [Trichostrongylus colubriformis]